MKLILAKVFLAPREAEPCILLPYDELVLFPEAKRGMVEAKDAAVQARLEPAQRQEKGGVVPADEAT